MTQSNCIFVVAIQWIFNLNLVNNLSEQSACLQRIGTQGKTEYKHSLLFTNQHSDWLVLWAVTCYRKMSPFIGGFNINKVFKNHKYMQIRFLKCIANFHNKRPFTQCLTKANNALKSILERMGKKGKEPRIKRRLSQGEDIVNFSLYLKC